SLPAGDYQVAIRLAQILRTPYCSAANGLFGRVHRYPFGAQSLPWPQGQLGFDGNFAQVWKACPAPGERTRRNDGWNGLREKLRNRAGRIMKDETKSGWDVDSEIEVHGERPVGEAGAESEGASWGVPDDIAFGQPQSPIRPRRDPVEFAAGV